VDFQTPEISTGRRISRLPLFAPHHCACGGTLDKKCAVSIRSVVTVHVDFLSFSVQSQYAPQMNDYSKILKVKESAGADSFCIIYPDEH
jgi:hypothetical protein